MSTLSVLTAAGWGAVRAVYCVDSGARDSRPVGGEQCLLPDSPGGARSHTYKVGTSTTIVFSWISEEATVEAILAMSTKGGQLCCQT